MPDTRLSLYLFSAHCWFAMCVLVPWKWSYGGYKNLDSVTEVAEVLHEGVPLPCFLSGLAFLQMLEPVLVPVMPD